MSQIKLSLTEALKVLKQNNPDRVYSVYNTKYSVIVAVSKAETPDKIMINLTERQAITKARLYLEGNHG